MRRPLGRAVCLWQPASVATACSRRARGATMVTDAGVMGAMGHVRLNADGDACSDPSSTWTLAWTWLDGFNQSAHVTVAMALFRESTTRSAIWATRPPRSVPLRRAAIRARAASSTAQRARLARAATRTRVSIAQLRQLVPAALASVLSGVHASSRGRAPSVSTRLAPTLPSSISTHARWTVAHSDSR